MKYPLATQTDTTKMAPLEGDDVSLSNPSFEKEMQEGNALGILTRSYPQSLIFGGSVSYARPTEARRDLKEWGQITQSLESALGAKKPGRDTSYPHANLRRRRPRLGPWSSRGCVNIKTLTVPRGMYSP
jgi:hypothetical protein